MNRYFDELARFERDDFIVVVDKTWEDVQVRDCFDDSCYDIKDLERKVNEGLLDWFLLRVRVLLDDYEMGTAYLGGCLYEDASEVLTDGTAEDLIETAIIEARNNVFPMMRKLIAINEKLERESI